MMALALIILAAMTPVFLMMWFDDIEARHERERTLITLDEAKEFGALYGTCCVCARTLTNEESISQGIGPVCGGRLVA